VPLAFYFFSDITLKKSWIPTAWLLAPLSFYLLLRKNALGTFSSADVIAGIDNVLVKAEGLEYFATATKICGLYIWKLIVPHPLSHDYSLYQIPLNGISDPYFWFSGLVYLALFWIVYKGWKSRNIFAFSVLFLLITFSLYSNMFIMIGTHFGERLMFLPSLGFSIGLSGLLYAWSTKSSSISFQASKSMLPILLFVLVLLSYGFKTQLRNADWKSEYDLYTADVINSPESSRTHYRLGMAYMKERALLAKDEKVKNQWLRKAVGELKKAIEIYPGYADAQGELGLAYQRLGYLDLAVERYNIVLAKKPTHKTTLNNMGTVLFNQAKFEQAIDYFLRALKSDPKYKDAMGNLASCYGTIGQYDEAIKWFKKAIDIDPTNASYYYFVGVTYQRMNKPKEAESWLLQAYVLDPSLKPKN
jgi:Tfp pilus assembly protein PilF